MLKFKIVKGLTLAISVLAATQKPSLNTVQAKT